MIILELIQGLAILARYVKPNEFSVRAEHDQIWAGPGGNAAISTFDRTTLQRLGWFWDDGCGYSHSVSA